MDEDSLKATTTSEPVLDFPVIGIGASAGGLDAISEMFEKVEADTGMAFVLVQHLHPDYESRMAELVGRRTHMEMRYIEDGTLVEKDAVYLIPPGKSLTLGEGGRFRLTDFSQPRGLRRPIDDFLESLAAAQGDLAAGVVLSGTGADGTVGIRVIRDAGGLCIAQDPYDAEFDGMPTSAIATGHVDYVLPAGEIVRECRRFFARRRERSTSGQSADVSAHLAEFCSAIHESSGHDFSDYKRPTLIRRIARRMQVLGVDDAASYLDQLQDNPDEAAELVSSILINVTTFFRDKEYFDVLRREALEPLLAKSSRQANLRIWVPGCSTGQEAYSIAMLIDSIARERDIRPAVQIFASDIDPGVIEIAREGRYPTVAMREIPEAMHEHCTIAGNGYFQIVGRIRDMVRFSVHSFTKDPPFSKLDLVSCRNLLIYLGEITQKRLIPLAHYSLRPGGYLFLGPSEGISKRTDLFTPINQKARLFRRLDAGQPLPTGLFGYGSARRSPPPRALPHAEDFPPARSHMTNQRFVYDHFGPPYVIVDRQEYIIESSPDLSMYVQASPGGQRQTLSSIARPGLREIVGQLIERTIDQVDGVAIEGVEIVSQFGKQVVDVFTRGLPDGNIALVFVNVGSFRAEYASRFIEADSDDSRAVRLQRELGHVRHRLSTTVEELETANEELKSSNEEMMSMNEELQSANEELETANEELKTNLDQLAVANDDLDNILITTRLGILVVDGQMRLRLFTDPMKRIFRLQEADRGRRIEDVRPLVSGIDIVQELRRVVDEDEMVEHIVRAEEIDAHFLMRIVPYHSSRHGSNGAVAVFSDVTRLKKLEFENETRSERYALALEASVTGVWDYDVATGDVILDGHLREVFGFEPDADIHLTDCIARIDDIDRPRVEAAFERTVETGQPFDERFRLNAPGQAQRWLSGLGRRSETSRGPRVVGVNFDVTFETEATERQMLLMREMNHRVKNLFTVLSALLAITARDVEDKATLVGLMRERIAALGRAYEITQNASDMNAVGFGDLIRKITEPVERGDTFEIEGAEIALPVRMLTPLGLILHELTTNAIKYGSLREELGRVRIKAQREGNTLCFEWCEMGAKAREELPDAPGFGSFLIDQSLRQLDGTVERKWKDGRLCITLCMPFEIGKDP